ncbi:copper resistance D family protein [Bosea sp. LjRoot237]|uniref:copper resistance D family protein n=1 Tax=Bosea sp. LjRoot237 TaxID=3342292 RepID=UPI003ECD0C2F
MTGAALDLLLRLARGIELMAALTAFGTLAIAFLVPRSSGDEHPFELVRTGLRRLLRHAIVVALIASIIWLPLQALRVTGGEIRLLEATRLIAVETVFGHALLIRFGLLALILEAAGDLRSPWRVGFATLLAAAAVTLQPWLGHAAAASTPTLPVQIALHTSGAGLWIGALPALLIVVARLPIASAAIAVRRFSWLGLAAVSMLAATGVLQSLPLIGDLGGLFGTPYGLLVLGKAVALMVLLALAALNRFVLTPKLAAGARRPLLISIAIELALGIGTIAMAAWLANQPPGAHEQPAWPFPLQPELSRIDEAYFAKELWRAAALVAVAGAGLLALFWRRTRLVGPLAAAVAIALLPFPNLPLLAKPAWPTSFQRSETGFTAASILRGEALLKQHCTPDCFRPRDDPSDPTPYGLWQRPDGDLYGWLTETFDRIGHSPFPHGTIAALGPRERWQLIDYFRARVAGTSAKRSGVWRHPVLTPDFPILCRDGSSTMRDILGRSSPIEITIADELRGGPEPAPDGIKLARVLLLSRDSQSIPGGFDCLSSSPDALAAFALMTGLDEARLSGVRLLVDANGWLRSRILPAHPEAASSASWRDEFARIVAEPFEAGGIGTHRH